MTIQERIAQAIHAQANAIEADGKYWGSEYARRDKIRADAMRLCAKIAREIADEPEDATQDGLGDTARGFGSSDAK